jgi:solute carrier family 25 carnitine/acylcarnitine transporter 20/29
VEGWAGLWKGVNAAMARAIPVNAAIFLAVEGTRQLIADTEESVDSLVQQLTEGSKEAAGL